MCVIYIYVCVCEQAQGILSKLPPNSGTVVVFGTPAEEAGTHIFL